MNSFLFFVISAIIEYVLVLFITRNFPITYNYSTFRFDVDDDLPNGMNVLILVFFPTILLIILSAFLYKFNLKKYILNIFVITILYHIIRIISIILIGRGSLRNWKMELFCMFCSIILSIVTYYGFISKTDNVFVTISEIREGIWIAIIIFFAKMISQKIYENSHLKKEYQFQKINMYVDKMYKKFRHKYSKIVNSSINDINNITYSIMIYENYNRPPIIRIFEYIKLFISGSASLGIMQVYSKEYINNDESVRRAFQKIENEYKFLNKEKINEIEKVQRVASIYNKSSNYVDDITSIYKIICKLPN